MAPELPPTAGERVDERSVRASLGSTALEVLPRLSMCGFVPPFVCFAGCLYDSPGNPSSTRPEKMCWGQAMSKDLLHWEVDEAPMLEPTDGCGASHSSTYVWLPLTGWTDRLGCWTGCYIPHGPRGEKGVVTVAYTAVRSLLQVYNYH